MNGSKKLLQKIAESKVFRDYQKAFSSGTGLPLALTSPENWGLPLQGQRSENPLCALLAGNRKACGLCLEMQKALCNAARNEPATKTCSFGMSESAVPVKLGEEVIGFLQTGQVRLSPPSREDFDALLERVGPLSEAKRREVETAFFEGRTMDSGQYRAIVHLLKVFAEHLSLVANQIMIQEKNSGHPMVQRACAFIEKSHTEDISLEQVAKSVSTSPFYFCKVFKRETGLTFTEYLNRVRVERTKELLCQPHLRISEIAYEVGFQSLSQFNRVFRKTDGQSPTRFRSRLLGMKPAA